MSKYGLILLLLFLGCTVKPKTTVPAIKLMDSGSLQIKGIANDILHEINRDSATTTVWQSLIPVYRMPKDTDLKDYQTPQPGKYVVTDSAVVFTPDTPFTKQQAYFLRFYQFGGNNDMLEYMQHRKKLGQVPFTDLSFKGILEDRSSGILGVWIVSTSKTGNASFVLEKNTMYYPETQGRYKYSIVGDSIRIKYDDYTQTLFFSLRGTDTLLLKGSDENHIYLRVKK